MNNLRIETLPNYRIAYVRHVGPYGPANVQTMEKLKSWAKEKHLFKSAIIFGIPQDHPEITPPNECRYDACIVISNDFELDDSICEGEFTGSQYAIYKVNHTEEGIQKAWADIFPAIQNSGYQIDNKPIIERYTYEMINNGFCELCVPIR